MTMKTTRDHFGRPERATPFALGALTLFVMITGSLCPPRARSLCPPLDTDGGSNSDASLSTCGNGELEDNESCDDGNVDEGDGCSAECSVEELSWIDYGDSDTLSRRYSSAMVYDEARHVAVLFGGHSDPGFHGDTWEWNGTSWTERQLVEQPGERRYHAMAYDSARGKTVLFGGNGNPAIAGDTWEYDGSNWIEVEISGPSGRWGHAMAYDEARGVTVLFGGFTATDRSVNDTWEFDGLSWTQVETTDAPPVRVFHGMTYDPHRERVVVFGGSTDYGSFEYLSDTWEFDGTTWSEVNAGNPPVRSGPVLVFDDVLESLVLFGGTTTNLNTWFLKDGVWMEQTALASPSPRTEAAATYDPMRRSLVVFGGRQWYSPYTVYRDTWELRFD